MAKKRNDARTEPRRATVTEAAADLPAWVVPLTYALVTVLLFREFFLSGTSMLGMDTVALSYFARNFYTEFIQAAHRMPYWNPLLMGGLPFVEGMHGDIFYPPSLALFFMDARTMWGWKMALHIFLAGAFTYLWLRRGLRLDRIPAFFGGLVYMMGADLVSLVLPGGDGKLFVSTLAPLVFWLAERAVRERGVTEFAAFALGIALLLFTSHMQAAYYCVWGVSLYFLFRVWQTWRAERSGGTAAKLVGLYAVAGVLGVGAAAVQFLPPLEYLREYSHRVDRAEERGYEWSSTYSLNAEEVASLVVPEFVGELAQTSTTHRPGGYWGRNPLKLNHEYAGLVPLLLIPVLLLYRRTAQVWFFAGLAVLTLLYALASSTPVGRLFYLIPGVPLFRSWSIIIFLYGLSVATLGALGLQALLQWLRDPRASGDVGAAARRVLWIAAGVLGLLALLTSAGILLDVWTTLFYRGLDAGKAAALEANRGYITGGFWLATLIAAAVAGAWELATRGYLTARAFAIALIVLAALDLYRVGRPFVQMTALLNEYQVERSTLLQADDAIRELQRRQAEGGVFRALDLAPLIQAPGRYGQNDLAVHGIEQMAGHHGNELGRYRNLIGGELPTNMDEDLRLASITNTEYMLVPGRLDHPALEEAYLGTNTVLYRNRNALPRAYLVGAVEVVPGDGAIDRVLSPEFDARATAVVPEPLPAGVTVQPGATGTVQWVRRDTDRLELRVAADRPALLMVLDNWYPAWRARVGGADAPVFRANHTFRAIPVPAGESTVELWYEPGDLRTGATISLAVLALLLAVLVGGSVTKLRRPA